MKRRLDDGTVSAEADSGGFPKSHSPKPRTLVAVQPPYSQPVSVSTVQYSLPPSSNYTPNMPVLGGVLDKGSHPPSNLPGGATQPQHSNIHQQMGQMRPKPLTTVVTNQGNTPEPHNQLNRLKVEDALSYLDQVKFKFGNQPQVYNDFLDIMKEFKSQSIDTPGVITRVSNLFNGHPELIVGFNTFLPPGYKIEISSSDQGYSFQVSVSVPSPSAANPALNPSSTVHHTTTTTHHVINQQPSLPPSPAPVKAPLMPSTNNTNNIPSLLNSAISSNNHSISQVQVHQAVQQALNLVETGHAVPHNQPVEFNHAINYVNKIKNRFQGQPDKYKKFLEILHAYQKEQKTNKDLPVICGKTLTEAEVYSQVAKLFENQEDLLAEFGKFLPESTNPNAFSVKNSDHTIMPRKPLLNTKLPAVYPNNNNVSMGSNPNNPNNINMHNSSGGSKYIASSNSSVLKRSASFSNTSPMYHVPAKKLKPLSQLRNISLADAAKWGNLNDYAFFDKTRKALHNQQLYENFLRCLFLFNYEVLSDVELYQVVSPFLGKFPDLMKWFKEFLSLNESNNSSVPVKIESSETEYLKPQVMPPLLLSAMQPRQDRTTEERSENLVCTTLDYTNLKRLGASYCALPKNYVQPRCSGRTPQCKEVLNDIWVSFPTWSEDSTFVTSRKTQFEEYIYRCEDERFELDVVLETNAATIKVLDAVNKKMARMSSDEISKFQLDDCLGGSSSTIHIRALRRVYGDKALDIIDGVKKNPSVAIPVVLKRLKAKDEEWREAQKGFNRIWKEQNEKFYLKSLDHQGINFKQNDIKILRSKSLFNEIETLFEERNEQCPGPHLVLEYRDKSIIDDAANLLIHHVKRQVGIHKEDKQKIKALIRQFIPDLFHHQRQELSDDEKDDMADNDSSNPGSPKPEENSSEKIKKEDDKDEAKEESNETKLETDEVQSCIKDQSPAEEEADVKVKEEKENNSNEKKDVKSKSKERNAPSIIPPYRDEHYTLFFGNNYWYLFFRLHQFLCDRLTQMYEHASDIVNIESKHKSSRQESTAVALRLRPKTEIEVEDYYPALLDMVKNVLDGNMESTSYEDTLRELFGIHAYIAFTLDKIVSNAVRQLQHLVSDEGCIECYDLFIKESKKGATGGMCETAYQRTLQEQEYQKKAEAAMTDEMCFKIIIYKKDCKLSIELLDTESSDNENDDTEDNDKENENEPDHSTQDSEKWPSYPEEKSQDESIVEETKVDSEPSQTDMSEQDQDTPDQ